MRRMALDCGGARTGRRRGRRTLPVDCWLRGNHGGGLGLPDCSEEHGASFYSATGLAPRRWIRSTTGCRCYSCRASWRRRTRADEHEDKHGPFPGAAGALGGLGGAVHVRGSLPTPVCHQELCQWRCRETGVAWGVSERSAVQQWSRGQGRVALSAAVRRGGSVRARAKRALWARPEHARQVFDAMPARSRELG